MKRYAIIPLDELHVQITDSARACLTARGIELTERTLDELGRNAATAITLVEFDVEDAIDRMLDVYVRTSREHPKLSRVEARRLIESVFNVEV